MTAICPPSPPIIKPGGGWALYTNPSGTFHCGYSGYLEDREPTPEDPIAECFYDNCDKLVDENHPYSACGGTADQYRVDKGWWKNPSQYKKAWDHAVNDSGGIVNEGWEAYWESKRHKEDTEAALECNCNL